MVGDGVKKGDMAEILRTEEGRWLMGCDLKADWRDSQVCWVLLEGARSESGRLLWPRKERAVAVVAVGRDLLVVEDESKWTFKLAHTTRDLSKPIY
ncbi:hypothetical protein RIF29_27866 [Crotalaria pallida]|uniref:Uncharacterized protein n=1 Tax=Crotalaria pallida TaxID=3830 RepID=A0AAN9EQD6_CROPI